MTIKKIISGGQTGADIGGLRAGLCCGLLTGGTAPYNWMTADGPKQGLLESYGLVAGDYDARVYPKRTKDNVANSDGTVLFGNVGSPGCSLTVRYCKELGKPFCTNPSSEQLCDWIRDNRISVLNVAGNREHTNPGIELVTLTTVVDAVNLLKNSVGGIDNHTYT
jgi:hypothetical protein